MDNFVMQVGLFYSPLVNLVHRILQRRDSTSNLRRIVHCPISGFIDNIKGRIQHITFSVRDLGYNCITIKAAQVYGLRSVI